MGGSPGGTQTTTNTASYPKEFRPLAKGAAGQILDLQNQLPLAGFGQAHPGQTAGISPYQQAVLNFTPQLLAPSWGLSALQNLGQPINQIVQNAGSPSSPYAAALNALSSGGFGTGRPVFPSAGGSLPTPSLTSPTPQSTVVGPGTSDLVSQLQSQLSSPVPSTTPILNAVNPSSANPGTPPSTSIPSVAGKSGGQLSPNLQQFLTQNAPASKVNPVVLGRMGAR